MTTSKDQVDEFDDMVRQHRHNNRTVHITHSEDGRLIFYHHANGTTSIGERELLTPERFGERQ